MKPNYESGLKPLTPRKLGYKLGLDTPLCLALNIDNILPSLSARELRASA